MPTRPPPPGLADLLAGLEERLDGVGPGDIPALLGELERLKATLWARMMSPNGDGSSSEPQGEDRLLTAQEAAAKLGVSGDWLYRRSKRLPFAVRLGRHLRFSSLGIEKFIRQRQGR